MLWEVARPLAVGPGRLARLREELDQSLALGVLQLLGRKAQRLAGACQIARQAQRQRLDHRAAPLLRRHGLLEPLGQTGALEVRVEGGLDDLGIEEGLAELGHHVRISIEAVDGLDVVLAPVVEDVRDEQDVEVRRLHVGVDARLGQIHGAIGFYIHAHNSVHLYVLLRSPRRPRSRRRRSRTRQKHGQRPGGRRPSASGCYSGRRRRPCCRWC